MEFFAFLAVSLVAVWVFVAWNDMAVLSKRLKTAAAEIDRLARERDAAATEGEIAAIDGRLAQVRRAQAVSRAHYDRVYASFTGSRLAAVLGFAADPVAAGQAPAAQTSAPRTA